MANAQVVQVTVDGPSRIVNLPDDANASIMIAATSWDGGTTAALEGSTNGGRLWAPVREGGVPVVASSNLLLYVEGNGSLRLNVSGIGTTTGLELAVSYR